MATVYLCAHCHAVLALDEAGQPLPCEVHHDGAVIQTQTPEEE